MTTSFQLLSATTKDRIGLKMNPRLSILYETRSQAEKSPEKPLLHTSGCLSTVGQLSGTQCVLTGSLRRIYEYEDARLLYIAL